MKQVHDSEKSAMAVQLVLV